MKVSSPVGTFPFTFDRIELRGAHVTVRGHMGAWPSEVTLGIDDVPTRARLAIGAAALVTAALVCRRLRAGSRRRRPARHPGGGVKRAT